MVMPRGQRHMLSGAQRRDPFRTVLSSVVPAQFYGPGSGSCQCPQNLPGSVGTMQCQVQDRGDDPDAGTG